MDLFNTGNDAAHQDKSNLSNCPKYLPHKDEPVDLYKKYQANRAKLGAGHRNSSNFFDDSDTKDRYWFNVARRYFKKVSSSS